jgi:nucleotide-binding universal stress UspA family protein
VTAAAARLPVVVGVGPGGPGGDALDWAAAEAAVRGVPLRVVHAVPTQLRIDPWGVLPPSEGSPAGPAERARWLAAAVGRARSVAPDVPVTGRVLLGSPARLLVQHSRAAGLVVLGGRDRNDPGGRPADVLRPRLAARARRPVVVVRTRPRVPLPARPRVVVGVDGARSCVAALGFAFEAAAQRGIALTAVHAWGPDLPADLEGVCASSAVVEAGARETLDRVLDRWLHRYPGVPVARRVVQGDPASVLLAASAGAALVVTGCRGRGPVRSRVLGSVSRTVAEYARGPVAVVGSDCPVQGAAPQDAATDRGVTPRSVSRRRRA